MEYEEWLEKNPGKNEKSELNNITQSGYKILDLIHFYTIGREIRNKKKNKNYLFFISFIHLI